MTQALLCVQKEQETRRNQLTISLFEMDIFRAKRLKSNFLYYQKEEFINMDTIAEFIILQCFVHILLLRSPVKSSNQGCPPVWFLLGFWSNLPTIPQYILRDFCLSNLKKTYDKSPEHQLLQCWFRMIREGENSIHTEGQ